MGRMSEIAWSRQFLRDTTDGSPDHARSFELDVVLADTATQGLLDISFARRRPLMNESLRCHREL